MTKVYAHRGASMYAPENTMPALELAHELSADGVEIDVRLTKDQVPILIHDETVDRTTDGEGYVRDYTLREIQQLDAGSWFDDQFKGTRIITLEDFLLWAQSCSLMLNIELKVDEQNKENFEEIVYEQIEKHGLIDRTIISSFHVGSLKRIKSLDLPLNSALLTSKASENLIEEIKDLNLDGLHIHYKSLDQSLVDEAEENNLPIRVYTVNDVEEIKELYSYEITGLITDVPDKAIRMRKKIEQK